MHHNIGGDLTLPNLSKSSVLPKNTQENNVQVDMGSAPDLHHIPITFLFTLFQICEVDLVILTANKQKSKKEPLWLW